MLDEIDAVLEVEIDKTNVLTLSDLIRNGSRMHKQCIGNWYGEKGETCALSAALDGAKALGLV